MKRDKSSVGAEGIAFYHKNSSLMDNRRWQADILEAVRPYPLVTLELGPAGLRAFTHVHVTKHGKTG